MTVPVSNVRSLHRTPTHLLSILECVVPDTDIALPGRCMGEAAVPRGVLWQRQKRREAEILRQTRILIGQSGYAAFSIRKVAEKCDLAPQTVYNLVGDREQLLEAAIGQHVNAMITAARTLDGPPGFFMAFADVLWGHALKNPAYARTVTRVHLSARGILLRNVEAILTGVFRSELAQLANSGALREGIDVALVAERMQALIFMTAITWVETGGDDIALRQQLVAGLGLLLLGAMKASARGPIEEWTDAAQALGTSEHSPRSAVPRKAVRS